MYLLKYIIQWRLMGYSCGAAALLEYFPENDNSVN